METEYYWIDKDVVGWTLQHMGGVYDSEWDLGDIPAPLATEILERLPYELCDQHGDLPYFLTIQKREEPNYYVVYYYEEDRGILGDKTIEAPTLAQAVTDMYIHLIKEELT